MSSKGTNSSILVGLFLAARPKTLLACIVPVCLGGLLSREILGEFTIYLFVFTLFPAMSIQIATNYFNDAIDYSKGADTSMRIGPERMAASGRIDPRALLIAGIAFVMMALTLSLVLFVERGWVIVAIGLPSLYFSYGYTGGPFPLAYRGLGEVFVMLFFGIIAVAGTVFVQSGEWLPESFLLGAQIGFLSSVLIAVNNARDIVEDNKAGKLTLAVRFGLRFARWEIAVLSFTPYIAGFLWWMMFDLPNLMLTVLPGLGLSFILVRHVWRTDPGRSYNRCLGFSIISLLSFAFLFSVGLILE